MSEEFKVGDVVVCVDDRDNTYFQGHGNASCYVTRGRHYRVAGLSYPAPRSGKPRMKLAGAVDPDGHLVNLRCNRFRKIDADVTEEFRSTLRKLPTEVQA